MANLFLVSVLSILGMALTSNAATTYTVGDNSGWDISTNLNTWASDKKFQVGDALVFLYSSSHSLSEVTKQNFDSCNTTNVINTYSNGNTTVPLTKSGARYFVCGNKLHCFGGMKLQVNVEGDDQASPTPQTQPNSSLPRPSSKSNNPADLVPTSSSISGRDNSVVLAFLCFMSTVFWVV
ncbi:hypothetical protein LWI29_032469 [Acer saccharum]|uniref:Phytocyanin domain-containing protein n=1 Tax=Acer saccharum TaxID=4024 RepID=A0AA39W127_ACESA|nr:hypothetical protein LWI29_032469 [Acer saccharum]KAK1575273.1 hypothetical protein Q3G72_003994 [Acer saccharum]